MMTKRELRKLIQVVSYMIDKYDGRLNYTKLIKLLYLADRRALDETDVAITGDTYVSMRRGVVLSQLYDLIKGKGEAEMQREWEHFFKRQGNDIIRLIPTMDIELLSEQETDTLDIIDSSFHSYSFKDMINFIHDNCSEWKDPKDSSNPLEKEVILKTLGRTDSQIKDILEEEESFAEEQRIFEEYGCCV